jgi:hypothetical protein
MLCGAPSKQKPNRDPAMPLCHIPVPHEVRSELWPISNLQECGRAMSGCRSQQDRDLAVLLLAELAAIPMRDTDRMRTVLRKARVVDDPGIDRSVRTIFGSTNSRTLATTMSSDHAPSATKCKSA